MKKISKDWPACICGNTPEHCGFDQCKKGFKCRNCGNVITNGYIVWYTLNEIRGYKQYKRLASALNFRDEIESKGGIATVE